MEKNIRIGEQSVRIIDSPMGDFISLTDLAKLVHDDTSRVISKWIELVRTLDFLNVWEKANNPAYLETAFLELRTRAGVPNFFLSTSQWIERTGAIGLEMRLGRSGGTFAHHLIALEFCSTMDAEFRFKVFREYTEMRLQVAENWLKSHEFFLNRIEDNALENTRLAAEIKSSMKKLGK